MAAKNEDKENIVAVSPGDAPLRHAPLRIGIVIVTTSVYFAALFFNILAVVVDEEIPRIDGVGFPEELQILNVSLHYGDIIRNHRRYPLALNFKRGLMVTWIATFLFDLIFVIFCLSSLCRSHFGAYVYIKPNVIHPVALLAFCFAWILQVCWVFVLSSPTTLLFSPFVVLALACLSRLVGFSVAVRALRINQKILSDSKSTCCLFFVQVAHNGCALFCAWTGLLTFFQFGTMLIYMFGEKEAEVTTLILALWTAEMLIWFLVDLIITDRYTRHVLTPYLLYVAISLALLLTNFPSFALGVARESDWILGVHVVADIFFLIKVGTTCFRNVHSPLT